MKIITVIEDTAGNPQCKYEHGLCVYVETEKHRLLLDTGATDAFLGNAGKLGIDVGKIDTVVLSHGHYDHSGGILAFAGENSHAPVYMQKTAAGNYCHGERYIGIDPQILELPQVRLLEGNEKLDEELSIFTGITGRRFWPQGNLALKKRTAEGEEVQDQFDHEQCLVITQGEKHILLSGCAHNGILNILDRYRELYHSLPDVVISGFHMMKKAPYTEEEKEVIEETARELRTMDTIFYTGHCTGQSAFDLMKPILGEKLQQLHSGQEILIPGCTEFF